MKIIPGVNCKDFGCVKERAWIVEGFEPKGEPKWIHIDISDGKFTPVLTWNDPESFAGLGTALIPEVHLMVKNPEEYLYSWLKAGAKRIVVHPETLKSPGEIVAECDRYGAEAMLSLGLKTKDSEIIEFRFLFKNFQVLAIPPGESGQKFRKEALQRIKYIREIMPDAIIEVDGGIDFKTAELVKDAGADMAVSTNYIFSAKNPEENYSKLKNL